MHYTPLFFLAGAMIVCFPKPVAQVVVVVALWRIWITGWKR